MGLGSRTEMPHGGAIPRLGLGVYRSAPGGETRRAVEWALEAGYRHVDTAAAYRNEADVGEAVRGSGIAREELFVTTKLWNEEHGYEAALRALDGSLERLGLDHVDLYLIHWPVEGVRLESWRALERLHREGRARAIGVSNYMVHHLEELLAACEVAPAVNQIELHPFLYRSRREVVELCRARGMVVEAYSPLTKAQRLEEPVLVEIARLHGKTPAQVLIRYALDHGWVVLPKSTHRERIRENAEVFDFRLSSEELARLDALDEGLATGWDPGEAP
jgi:diketogulonate reductase-like aldo/keto reductase